MIDLLARQIWARSAFHEEYTLLLQSGIAHSVGLQSPLSEALVDEVIPRLLECAGHFAGSARTEHRAAAYRIATTAWEIVPREYGNLRQVVRFVLGRLGNFPAANFLLSTTEPDLSESAPLAVLNEVEARAFSNSVEVVPNRAITLTDFQRGLWDTLASGQSAAITAPTSAGKSFVLQHYLVSSLLRRARLPYSEKLRLGLQGGGWGLYLVPTRALITQVSTALGQLSEELSAASGEAARVPIITIPLTPSEVGADQGIYVLTQERLQTLLEAGESLNVEIAIIDEAQGIADGARGVILQTVIEQLQLRSPSVQLLFGSPQTRNPEVFRNAFALERLTTVTERESPVAQNLIVVSTNPRQRNLVAIETMAEGTRVPLGQIDVRLNLSPGQPQALAVIAWMLGKNQKNLVYAGGPAACEEIAALLTQLAESESTANERPGGRAFSEERSRKLQELADYLAEHVHPQYQLVPCVQHGVGFHYGNMPAAVRRAIEDYFSEGLFSHLVSTSTLLAGVNLPARNIFLQKPTKGQERERSRGVPISSIDFWNLAGRAGRLGKDFEGDVFLIDLDQWQTNPLEGERDQEIVPALDLAVTSRAEAFLQFIRTTDHASGSNAADENTFVKLVNEARRGTLDATLDRLFHGARPEVRDRIRETTETAAQSLRVPPEITERNIYVSVYRQDDLFAHLERKIVAEGPESVIPLHPLAGDGVYQSLLAVFGRIARHLERASHQGYVYYARLARLWMLGRSLRDLIQDAYEYKLQTRRSRREPSIASVIRAVMADIEQHLRFRYVKYTSCYNDLLRYALVRTGNEGAIEQIPTLPLYLELGASSNTMVSLIGLGLTRTTAGLVAQRAYSSDLGRTDASRWLRSQNWEATGLSPLAVREIVDTLRQAPA